MFSVDFLVQIDERITHADGAVGAPPIDQTDLRRPPSSRAGKLRAPSTVGRADANGEASAAPFDGPTVLDPPRQGLAGLALRLGRRAARYRGPMASNNGFAGIGPGSHDGGI